MADMLVAAAFYLFALVGSFSLGYLVLRFVYPEVRTFDHKNKALTVAVVALAIFLTSVLLDYAFSGNRVLALDSFPMLAMSLVTLFYFLALRTFFLYSAASRTFVTVGIPIPSAAPATAPLQQRKSQVVEKKIEVKVEVKTEKQVDISKKIGEIKRKIEEKKEEPAAKPVKVEVDIEKIEKKIKEKFEAEKLEEVKRLQEEKKQLQSKLDQELKAKEEERKKQAVQRDAELKALNEEKRALEAKLEEQKKIHEQRAREAAEQKNREMEEAKLKGQREQAEKQRIELEKRQAGERKKRLAQSIGESQTYLEKIQQRVTELKKMEVKKPTKKEQVATVAELAKVQEVTEVKEEKKLEQLKKDAIIQPVEVKLEIKTVTPPPAIASVPVSDTKKRVEEVKKRIEERRAQESTQAKLAPATLKHVPKPQEAKPGLFDFLFGHKKEPLPAKKPEIAKPTITASPAPGFSTWRTAREAEQKKKTEEKHVVETKKKEEADLQELVKAVTKQAEEKAATTEGPVHRRYLLKGEVKVIANKEVAGKEEFGVMVQDIYSQLKTTKTETKVTDVLKVDAPKEQPTQPLKEEMQTAKTQKPAPAIESAKVAVKPEAGVSMSDILGTDLFAAKPSPESAAVPLPSSTAAGGDIFAQLSQAASSESPGLPTSSAIRATTSDVSFVQMQVDKPAGCPTCHSKTTKVIFCPYCSTGMCANCSPAIKPLGPGQFTYVCPKCGEEVTVRKKAS